jgi:XTP/dITP diphosphohydrolase
LAGTGIIVYNTIIHYHKKALGKHWQGKIMIIWFATGNINKKKEMAEILIPSNRRDWEVKIPFEAGLAFDPEETGSTFLENALIKARALHRLLEECRPPQYSTGDPVIADDSGLCVDALDGRPGIYSARYGGKDLDYKEKNSLLLAEIGDNPLRSARFVCAMVLYYGESRFMAAHETLEGELALAAGGSGGFGYDPILYIPSLGRTVAELTDDEKNRLSHRGKAGRAIGRFLC